MNLDIDIVFFSNFLNHHQVPVADELYRLTGGRYVFVETIAMPESFRKNGYPTYDDKPYLLKAYESESKHAEAVLIATKAKVAVFAGYESLPYQRLRKKKDILSFSMSERFFKKGLLNLLSPRLLAEIWYYFIEFRNKTTYKLCCSAYTASDLNKILMYKDRCYKWGYFTGINDFSEQETETVTKQNRNNTPTILWCARFISWKHPEYVVHLARMLKDAGYFVKIDMIGEGIEEKNISKMCKSLGVEDMVTLLGSMPNKKVLQQMREHDMFLFTSDRNEGWGAALNEAMSSGCAVVASDEIGAVPFLVKDGANGFTFKSKNLNSLYEKVVTLIDNPEKRKAMAIQAYNDMQNIWSPKIAARNLLQLIDDLQNGRDSSITEGPCSKAYPI